MRRMLGMTHTPTLGDFVSHLLVNLADDTESLSNAAFTAVVARILSMMGDGLGPDAMWHLVYRCRNDAAILIGEKVLREQGQQRMFAYIAANDLSRAKLSTLQGTMLLRYRYAQDVLIELCELDNATLTTVDYYVSALKSDQLRLRSIGGDLWGWWCAPTDPEPRKNAAFLVFILMAVLWHQYRKWPPYAQSVMNMMYLPVSVRCHLREFVDTQRTGRPVLCKRWTHESEERWFAEHSTGLEYMIGRFKSSLTHTLMVLCRVKRDWPTHVLVQILETLECSGIGFFSSQPAFVRHVEGVRNTCARMWHD